MKAFSGLVWGVVCWGLCSVISASGQTVMTWDPGTSQDGSEVQTESSGVAGSYLFEITTQTNANSVGLWRSVLDVTAGEADLYIRQNSVPTTNSYSYKSERLGSDDITVGLTPGQTWYLLVEAEAGAEWSLFAGDVHVQALTWDPGTADLGSEVFDGISSNGAVHYFKLTTDLPDLGAWRTALRVTSGEADLYLRQNTLPYINSSSSSYTYSSALTGDDGVVRPLSNTSGNGQVWYIMVKPTDGAQWHLYSGDVYATDLGPLAADASSGSGLDTIPAEGIRYYRTTIPVETYAWRLWLQNAAGTATWAEDFQVRKGLAPHPSSSSYYDRTRTGQGLLVPTYLEPGGAEPYFVGIAGDPGTSFQLDSRQQAITDTTYSNTLVGESVSGFLFKTYRISVPPDQIAWEVTVEPTAGTQPDMAVRQETVPNAFNNDAYSELNSTTISDSITLVPTTLSDGFFYVTVYGDAALSYNLRNREPIITQIDFSSSTLNDDPGRAGWRFFAVSDIDQQLGQLGWLLELSDHVAGSEIAIRRNFVPGRWNYRQNGSTYSYERSYNDQSGTYGFLQDSEHQADVWYVGIYSPGAALGSFTLNSGPEAPMTIGADGFSSAVTSLSPKRWNFYYVTIPAQTNGQDVIGWEVRMNQWSGVNPYMVIRRDQLPEGTGTTSGFSPYSVTSWASGRQWSSYSGDWSKYAYDPGNPGHYNPVSILSMGMGRPLEAGSYFIGFYNNDASTTASYQFTSRLIGSGMSYDPQPISFSGGSVSLTNLPARDVAYYSVEVTSNAPSWKVQLENDLGETRLYLRQAYVPTWTMNDTGYSDPATSLVDLQKTGNEYFSLFPAYNATNIPAGMYYLMAVSEGQGPVSSTIGSGSSAATLTSIGESPITDLGTLPVAGELTQADLYDSGDHLLYQFTVPAGVLALEVRLENRVGEPYMHLREGMLFSDNYAGFSSRYGGLYSGRNDDDFDSFLITVPNPTAGTYSLLVSDPRTRTQIASGSYTLRIVTVGATTLNFDGGGATDVELPPNSWQYYRVTVPETVGGEDVMGWEVRVSEWAEQLPSLVIRRDDLPDGTSTTSGWYTYSKTNWPSGNQWATSYAEWTGFPYNPDTGYAVYNPQIMLSMAMGQPLEPGDYYVGFYNNSTTATSTYSFVSSGIGTGMSYPVTDVAFAGGTAAITDLERRYVEYFQVDVPAGSESWNFKLESSVGDSQLYARRDRVPTISAHKNSTYAPTDNQMTYLKKVGDEHFVLMPENGQTNIVAGRYYLMAVSEGQNPTNNTIGTGTMSGSLTSVGEAPITALGTLPQAGEISQVGSYTSGQVKLYQFTVPADVLALEVRLEDRVGNPFLHLREGLRFSDNYAGMSSRYGGLYSGHADDDYDASLVTVANPMPGVYSLVVSDPRTASQLEVGSYTLRIVTVGASEISFDGGGATDLVIPPNEWRYYRLDVPATEGGEPVLGWEVRLSEWSGYLPSINIRRDELPEGTTSTGSWYTYSSTNWPSGYQWSTTYHKWSNFSYDEATGSGHYNPQIMFSMPMGQPLEPGSYYIGLHNASATTTSTCSFASSAIGTGMTYSVPELPFDGGSAVLTNLAARTARYFQVNVPEGAASWKMKLDCSIGDMQLYLHKDTVPNISHYIAPTYAPYGHYTTKLHKDEDEHFVLLPENNQTTIQAGTYYLLAVSNGDNPDSTYAGTAPASAMLYSLGEAPVMDLGMIPIAGGLTHSNSFDAGEVRLYHVTVPTNSVAVEIRLEDRVGNPNLSLRKDRYFPNNYAGYGSRYGGMYSGYNYDAYDASLITVANPEPGEWSIVVSDPSSQSSLANGAYTLVVQDVAPPMLNVDPSFNTNGLSNVDSGMLSDDERAYYRVEVPDEIEGSSVIGWKLETTTVQGEAQVRVRKELLPQDNNNGQSSFSTISTIVAPPFLTSGTWYVEVKGVGATDYTLTSSAVYPERHWTMPAVGEALSTPGLPVPLFGDSGVDDLGGPLPVDQGVDLDNGYFHFYAVTVPDNNAGLLRTQLEAISGNPNLYIRRAGIPTLNHDEDGTGTLYERSLTGYANSEYGNWVPVNARYEDQLEPGIYYLMVKAEGASNARYRLKLSGGNAYTGGNVQDLALEGGSFSGQLLADDDMRYYRVVIPTNAPVNWEVTYSQQSGNVDLYVRDTIPPGFYQYYNEGVNYMRDWRYDNKNNGYDYALYAETGTHTLTTPQLRPGHVYYLGFHAKSDASFSVSSAISGGSVSFPLLDFETGFVSTNLAPGEAVTYQVNVPSDAVRWRHSHTNSSAVHVYVEQGTMPSRTSSDHWYRTSGTYSLDKYLWNVKGFPWEADQLYYVTATNTGASSEAFILDMNGSKAIEIPTNMRARDGERDDYVYVSWSHVSGANDYDLWRSTSNDLSTASLLASDVSSGYQDHDAEPGQLYYYWSVLHGRTDSAWFSTSDSGWIRGIGSIDPISRVHSAGGGEGLITVTVSNNVYWGAVENEGWLSISGNSLGTNSGSITYSVSEYAGSVMRTGLVTVAGQEFRVIQNPLGSLQNLQASDGDYEDRVALTWDPLLYANHFYIYRSLTDDVGTASYIGYSSTNQYDDISAVLDQVYYYWVRPYNGGGYGEYSASDDGVRSVPPYGVPASWISTHFPGGYPGDDVDSDGDGFTNLEEYTAGTDPNSPSSYFMMLPMSVVGGVPVVEWAAVSGRVYTVYWAETLTNSPAAQLPALHYPTGAYTDTVHSASSAGFYWLDVEVDTP